LASVEPGRSRPRRERRVKRGDLTGIFTGTHFDEYLGKLKQPVGLVRLNRGPTEQFGTLGMEEV
jgi:hypothetical protein